MNTSKPPSFGSRFRRKLAWTALLFAGCVAIADRPWAQTTDGAAVFAQNCASCHQAGVAVQRAPTPDMLRLLQPQFVMDTLNSGVMRTQGMRLNPGEMRAVAEYVTGKRLAAENF